VQMFQDPGRKRPWKLWNVILHEEVTHIQDNLYLRKDQSLIWTDPNLKLKER